jgi:lipid A 3-O-deacylase
MLIRLLLFLQLLPLLGFAQDDTSRVLLRSFGAAYQNDLLAATFDTTTDYYYTGGTFFELNLPCFEKNPVSKILVCLPQGRNESFGIGYAQVAFTPTNIEADSVLVGDRPFSGAIYVGFNRVTGNSSKRMRLTSRIDIGAIGPVAFAYETQKFIHAHTNNPEPRGWQFQIRNDLYLNYSVRLEKGLITRTAFEVIGYASTNIGTIYMNATAGVKLRAGRMRSHFETPAYAKRFLMWGYANGEYKVVGRDATLQGGLINRNSTYFLTRDNVKPNVFLFTVGVVACYHKFRLEYFNTFLTPEFSAGKAHMWGHLGVQYIF